MSKPSAFEAWQACIEAEQAGVLATVLQTESNSDSGRIFISLESVSVGDLGNETMNAQVLEIATKKLSEKNPQSETQTFSDSNEKEVHVFIDVYIPPIELIIFGAGHDAVPVASYSVSLGLRTIIVDSRSFYNTKERFPGTIQIVTKEEDFQNKVKIGSQTYIIVMNHHIEKDRETLKFVLKSESPYIGVLGPRSRRIRMMDALKEEGEHFSESQLSRIYSPIGLDIGASSSEEIAISILAEIIAIKNGHTGGFLKGAEFIHKAPEDLQ